MAILHRVLPSRKHAGTPLPLSLSVATSLLVVTSGLVAARLFSFDWQTLKTRAAAHAGGAEPEVANGIQVAALVLAAGIAFAVGFIDPWLREFGAWLGMYFAIWILFLDGLRRRYSGHDVRGRDLESRV